jgi:hypothetical protein
MFSVKQVLNLEWGNNPDILRTITEQINNCVDTIQSF